MHSPRRKPPHRVVDSSGTAGLMNPLARFAGDRLCGFDLQQRAMSTTTRMLAPLLLGLILAVPGAWARDEGAYPPLELNIAHINDHHSNLAPFAAFDLAIGGVPTRVEAGGMARTAARLRALDGTPNLLKLHAGDAITGTLFHTLFKGEADAAQRQIDALKAQGVRHIVLLTHHGYQADLALAAKLSDVDVIIGGDSHTLLGDFAAYGLAAAGPYPTRATNRDGEPVCVGQAWEYNKFVGHMSVCLDARGRVADCGGVWSAIDPARTDTLVTNDFLASGKEGYDTLGAIHATVNYVNTYLPYTQTFVDYVQAQGAVARPAAADYSHQRVITREGKVL